MSKQLEKRMTSLTARQKSFSERGSGKIPDTMHKPGSMNRKKGYSRKTRSRY